MGEQLAQSRLILEQAGIASRTKLFQLPPPDLEFFTGARRHGSNTSVFQEALENVLTATIVLTSTLVVLEVTSVT